MTEKSNVFIIEDHSVVIQGIQSVIEKMGDFQLTGFAQRGKEALESAEARDANIIILDISMPEVDGIDIAKEIKTWNHSPKILVYSMSISKEHIVTLFRIGVSGYVLKQEPLSELRLALQALKLGASFYSSQVREIVRDHLKELESDEGREDNEASQNGLSELSKRENEVFVLLADGLSVKEIAHRLYISPKTVESHKYNILEKLDQDSIASLTKIAAKKGLIDI